MALFNICENEFTVRMTSSLVSLQNQLGIGCIKWFRDEKLDSYILAIIEYLNRSLILSGACTILQRLQEFTDRYEAGTELIISGETETLAFQVGINTGDSEYQEEVFTMAWGIFMSSLYMQLMYNYSGVFDDSSNTINDCHSGCHQTDCGNLNGGANSSLGGNGNWESGYIGSNCGCGSN